MGIMNQDDNIAGVFDLDKIRLFKGSMERDADKHNQQPDINELSKAKLNSYRKKANREADAAMDAADDHPDNKGDLKKHAAKRRKGAAKASKKMNESGLSNEDLIRLYDQAEKTGDSKRMSKLEADMKKRKIEV